MKEILLLLRFKSYPNDPTLYTNNYITIIVFINNFLTTYY
jgi:hypothetical protein